MSATSGSESVDSVTAGENRGSVATPGRCVAGWKRVGACATLLYTR